MLFTIDTVVAVGILGWVIGILIGHAAGYGKGLARGAKTPDEEPQS